MTYTDKNIPIACAECDNWVEEGLRSMMIHILKAHPEYEPGVVYKYASEWMETAYEKNDEWEYGQLTSGQKRAYQTAQHGG